MSAGTWKQAQGGTTMTPEEGGHLKAGTVEKQDGQFWVQEQQDSVED